MRVERTHVSSKIVGKENPALAGFRTGDIAGPGFAKQRGGMHLQKTRGLFNRQGPGGFSSLCVAARRIGRLDTTNLPLKRLAGRPMELDFPGRWCMAHSETIASRLFFVHTPRLSGAR
jgi:hypothetical protein